MNDTNHVENVFYKLVYDILQNNIDEDVYITKIQEIINANFDLTETNDVKKIIYLLKQNGKRLPHAITMLMYTRQCLYKSLNDFMRAIRSKLYPRLRPSKTPFADSKTLLDNVIELKKKLKISYEYAKAFGGLQYNVTTTETIGKIQPTYDARTTEYIYKQEILNRFALLTKYYGVKQLKYFGITPLMIDDAYCMPHADLLKYYNISTRKIKLGIQKILSLCDMYLGIERGIILMLLTKDPDVKLGKYDVYIEDE